MRASLQKALWRVKRLNNTVHKKHTTTPSSSNTTFTEKTWKNLNIVQYSPEQICDKFIKLNYLKRRLSRFQGLCNTVNKKYNQQTYESILHTMEFDKIDKS